MKRTVNLLFDNYYLLISIQMFGRVGHVLNHDFICVKVCMEIT